MPSKFRAALVSVVMLFCALLPATASAVTSARRDLNYRYTAQSVPSDELFEEQWSLADDGLLGIQSAWDVSTGGSTVVAVIDTGADLTHPDLRDNLWRNPREIPGNGIDDDGNGFVDDVNGADFVNRDGDPSDDNGHGTHVAGILAARGANRVGVTGVAQRARLMVLKALGADAVGSAETHGRGRPLRGRQRREDHQHVGVGPRPQPGVRGGRPGRQRRRRAHDRRRRQQRARPRRAPEYPAAFPASHVIAVAATGRTGKLIGISNRGVGTVDIAAPGQGIVSTAKGGDYEIRTGTSMASPHVAGALVLLSSARPDLGADALQAALLGSAQARRRRHDRHARRRGRDAPRGLRRPLAQRHPRELGPRGVEVQGQVQARPRPRQLTPEGVRRGPPGAMVRRGVDLTTFIFMMLVLKLPLGALLYIVWWAIKSTPEVEGSDEGGGAKRWPHGPRPPRTPHPPRRGPHAEPPPPSPARTRTVVARGRDAQRS